MTEMMQGRRALTEQEKLFLARRRAKVRQEEIGGAIGISQSAVSRWERGKLQLPRYRVDQMWDAINRRMQ